VTPHRPAKLISHVPHPLSHVNELSTDEFVRLVGPVFEHSPWIAASVAAARPFASVATLHSAMCEAVRHAGEEFQIALIRAHPDLVGRVVLTAESKGEQASAGLTDLNPEEVALFDRYNREYKTRFGFPFVICARLNKKDAILRAFPVRLQNSPGDEITTALAEIFKIAHLRLADLIAS
jgi:2-oxo-4-hydroxy-4-carboxy-5-ureidoimidazoline decarboxylase